MKHCQKSDHLFRLVFVHMVFAAVIFLVAGKSARAQDQAAEDEDVLEEVIVTAQFRKQNLQDVPLALTAFDGKNIDGLGLTDVADILRRSPGVDFYSRGPNKSDVSIRGLSNLVVQSDFQRTSNLTGIYMDGVSVAVTFNSQRTWNLFDLERVEVLRGPQGTLYGEGAMGGAIRYVTASPNLNEFEARVNGTLSDTEGAGDLSWVLNGTVNIPVAKDTFGLRITAFARDDSGFIDYTKAGVEDANGFENSGVRAVGLWQVNERLSARVAVTREESTSESALDRDGANIENLDNSFHPLLEPTLDDATLVSAQIEYTTDYGTFSSITGYFDRDMDNLGIDPSITGPTNFPTDKTFLLDHKAFSEELRYVSNIDGPLSFMVGAYLKDSEQVVDLDEKILPPGPAGYILIIDETYDGKQYSLFGEVNYQVTDQFSFTAGLRYFNEKVDSSQTWTRPERLFIFVPTSTFTTDIEISKVLPKFVLNFEPTEDVLLYAGASQGARNGGLNVTSTISFMAATGTDTTPFRTFEDDSVWSYEVGAKTQWLDNRFTANIAGYYLDWTDIQVIVTSPPMLPFFPNGIGFVDNGDSARTVGAELELNFMPTENMHLFFGGNVADAEITEQITFNPTLGSVIPEGSPIPGVSDWTYNAGIDLTYPIGEIFGGNTEFVAHLNYQRFAKQASRITTGGPNAVPNFNAPEYGLLNLRLGLEGESWSVALFGNNITNEIVSLYPGSTPTSFFINKPRTFGITLDKRF